VDGPARMWSAWQPLKSSLEELYMQVVGSENPSMILRTIAFNTFGMFLRDKILIVVAILFTCGLLLMLTPLLAAKAMASMGNCRAGPVDGAGNCVSDFDFHELDLEACWQRGPRRIRLRRKMKSGTILAVMARPVKRWAVFAGEISRRDAVDVRLRGDDAGVELPAGADRRAERFIRHRG